ncbi:MAG: YigZ family protein [Lachnospiraceae bacterium]|nr:YigZ family protein [Lachnospiraceae bacterium]
MGSAYYVSLGTAEGEITEKKSRFIATVREVHSEEEANNFINELRKKYWDARHNCYAYVIGRNNEIARFSDDKEPQGTAGRPILDVLTGRNVRNTCIVVTRYFGGILLGTGGLVRAYSSAASAGMDNADICEVYPGSVMDISCDYSLVTKMQRFIADRSLPLIDTVYAENVLFKVAVRDEEIDAVTAAVTELSNGSSVPVKAGEMVFAVRDGKAKEYEF